MMPAEQGGDRNATQLNALSDAELDDLLGAYALNAVDDAEREAVDRYLTRSPRARAEVADHLLVAAALGSSAADAPVQLWDRIALGLSDQTPRIFTEPVGVDTGAITSPVNAPVVAPASVVVPIRPSRRRPNASLWLSSAAAAIGLVGFLGISNVQQRQRIDTMQQQASAQSAQIKTVNVALANADARNAQSLTVGTLLATPGTRVAKLSSDSGKELAEVVLGRDGRGFLVNTNSFKLHDGEVLQLWGVHNKEVISLGVMYDGKSAVPLSAAGEWSQFVLTSEMLPGVVASDGPALAVGAFSV